MLAGLTGCRLGIVVILAAVFSGGCLGPGLDEDSYGTTSRENRSNPDGTRILQRMFSLRGNKVSIENRITPRVDKYGTIVWFMSPGFGCPSEQITTRLNQWMAEDSSRRLILVGWGVESSTSYWSEMVAALPDRDAETAMRRRARAVLKKYDQEQVPAGFEQSCEWVVIEPGVAGKINELILPDGEMLDVSDGSIEHGPFRITPGPGMKKRNLLTSVSDGESMVWAGSDPEGFFNESLIVIENASFLLNFALVNKTNRLVASVVVDEIEVSDEPVMFLVTGATSYSDRIYENESAWSWINQPPARYIIPHFLVLGLVYLFSVSIGLGRPKRSRSEISQPGFGKHIRATADLLRRACDPALLTSLAAGFSRDAKPAHPPSRTNSEINRESV